MMRIALRAWSQIAAMSTRSQLRRDRRTAMPARARISALAIVLLALVAAGPARAGQDLSQMCEHAAIQAAKVSGVPISVLKAIALSETGRKRDGAFRPWPWTVNMEGKGVWFDTEDEARAYVYDRFKRGARSFDVGCFQINYKWHHQAFTSIEQMFDPLANALYAAEFLNSLKAEKGSWGKAAGAYHSRTPSNATRYQARFESIRAKFLEEDGLPLPDVPETELAAATEGVDQTVREAVIRINSYPLLQPGDSGAMGSLVPLSAAAGRSLVAPAPAPADPAPDQEAPDQKALVLEATSDPETFDPLMAEQPIDTLGAIY